MTGKNEKIGRNGHNIHTDHKNSRFDQDTFYVADLDSGNAEPLAKFTNIREASMAAADGKRQTVVTPGGVRRPPKTDRKRAA